MCGFRQLDNSQCANYINLSGSGKSVRVDIVMMICYSLHVQDLGCGTMVIRVDIVVTPLITVSNNYCKLVSIVLFP